MEFFRVIPKLLFNYSTFSHGTPNNVQRKTGWETLLFTLQLFVSNVGTVELREVTVPRDSISHHCYN